MAQPVLGGIDHALIGVADLEAARLAYQRLGFTVTPRGRHKGWATGNYCVMFPGDYLELLGQVEPVGFTNGLDRALAEGGERLLGLAMATGDAMALRRLLAGRGIDAPEPAALSRLLELPEGDVEPRFSLLRPDLSAINGFFCQHLTPELLVRPAWLTHANTVHGIKSAAIAVEDPVAAAEPYGRIYGLSAVVPTDDMVAVHAGRSVLLFVRPDDALSLYGLEQEPRPGPFALTLHARDLAAATAALVAGGVAFDRVGRTLAIDPADACGAVLLLV